jgi:hypothetical protein
MISIRHSEQERLSLDAVKQKLLKLPAVGIVGDEEKPLNVVDYCPEFVEDSAPFQAASRSLEN